MDVVSAWVNFCREFGMGWSQNDTRLSREAFFAGAEAAEQSAPATGLRRCPACHALLEERSVYCDTCGTDMPRAHCAKGLCVICGRPKDSHRPNGHDFREKPSE